MAVDKKIVFVILAIVFVLLVFVFWPKKKSFMETDSIIAFKNIYESGTWGNDISQGYKGSSGGGSELEYNINTYIPFLKKFIKEHDIHSVVDLGCGSFKCGNAIYDDLDDVKYTGYDAYEGVIESHKMTYPEYDFVFSDFYTDRENIKSADMCILKDVIQHWPLSYINTFMDYLVESKKFKYILVCNCTKDAVENSDISLGEFRPLSFDLEPMKKYGFEKVYAWDTKEVGFLYLGEKSSFIFNPVKCEHDFIRLGRPNDGGYVMLDNSFGSSVILGYGVSDDCSFENDVTERFGIKGFIFDHTVDSPPQNMNKERITFVKEGIADNDNEEKLKSLGYHIEKYAKDTENIILKMDVEGAEWKSLKNADLTKVSQLIIEMHWFDKDVDWDLIKRINDQFYLVNIHGNNFGPLIKIYGKDFPQVIECTWVRKDLIKNPEEYREPNNLNQKCNSNGDELVFDFI